MEKWTYFRSLKTFLDNNYEISELIHYVSTFLFSVAFKFMGNFKQTSNPIALNKYLKLP